MPSGPDPAGKKPTEFELDNMWYEAFADKVHSFGKKWPDPLTAEEYDACELYADSIVRRPKDADGDQMLCRLRRYHAGRTSRLSARS